ncbi:hypothetical protein ACSX1A_03295 [Pontibacter sp. MBLB2868]|uniref:hypothetical protein n=1 Tax=Pontibacter sp. MBLB2868 TaxID=3451555 RepID=UPI003F74B0FF
MKALLITALALISLKVEAQSQMDTTLIKEIPALKKEVQFVKVNNQKLEQRILSLNEGLKNQQQVIDSLSDITKANTASIVITSSTLDTKSSELDNKIILAETNTVKNLADLNSSVSQKTLYWFIGLFATALLSALLYLVLRKRLSAGQTNVEQQIAGVQKSLEEESVRLDNKLVEILASQVNIMKEERASSTNTTNKTEELDHSLALKVADEVTRIQMNLSHMDPTTKGLKQLDRAVKAISNNFQANGYEIIEMLNKPYDEGMKIIATMEFDEKLAPGQQLIKRVIKPQINYKGQMIQAAQVVVAYGEELLIENK